MPAPKKNQRSANSSSASKKKPAKKVDTKKTIKKKSVKEENEASNLIKKNKKSKSIVVDVIEDDFETDRKDDLALANFLNPSKAVLESEEKIDHQVEDLEIDVHEDKEDISSSDNNINDDSLDNQKRFFNELRAEVESKKEQEGYEDDEARDLLELFDEEDENTSLKKAKRSRSLNLYSGFVWKFLLIVAVITIFVAYFTFVKLTINIVPENESLNHSLLLKVSSSTTGIKLLADQSENVSGLIKNFTISLRQDFDATGEEFVGEDISGRVKIINNYSRNQALVATTRLFSPDNKLFRIKEAVNVAAGSEAWVDIYVEKPSRELAINPTTFTIPGLWVGLQDKIYAKSEEAFIFEQKKEKYIRASDLAVAEKEVSDALIAELLVKIEEEKQALEADSGQKLNYVYLQSDDTTLNKDAKAEDRQDSFSIDAEASFTVVFFSQEESDKLAYGKLNLLVPSNKELLNFNSQDIIYSLESYNKEEEIATIKSTFTGNMVIKSDGEIVKKESLVNLSADQLNAYLSTQSGIRSFELKFQPSFIKQAPKLVDRIKINLTNE